MNFPAKKDFGTATAFLVFLAVVIGFGCWELATEGANGTASMVVGAVLVFMVLLWVWFWFGTSYEITSTHVRIRCGPIRWRIALNEIVEAVPTSSAWLMVGGSHARFALSRDAILIKARNKVLGMFPHAVLISPRDRTAFLKELVAASPGLELSEDGIVRRRNCSTSRRIIRLCTKWTMNEQKQDRSSVAVISGVYEWAGLFLIALGMRKHCFAGRLHEATWNLWGGVALGGIAGAIVGGLIDFVRFALLKESALGGFAVPCWIYGGLLGGVVIGIAFTTYGWWRARSPTNEERASP